MVHDKTYAVEMTLGKTSTTGDQEGEITVVSDASTPPDPAELNTVLSGFVGDLMQIPPAYSAIKVDGKRAYDLARAGREVTLKSRPCTVYSIEALDYQYPKVNFVCRVSSGTYIRTLAEDIGKALKTGAYMSELRRLRVAEYSVEQALAIEELSYETIVDRSLSLT
jgi:tRNA pseudouridine55 synthase